MNNSINYTETNKLIAKFMGFVYVPWQKAKGGHAGWINPLYKVITPKIPFTFLGRSHNDLKYHRDWNWLMGVVEKIEGLDLDGFETTNFRYVDVTIDGDGCSIGVELNYDPFMLVASSFTRDKKMDVYNSVSEFIKWLKYRG